MKTTMLAAVMVSVATAAGAQVIAHEQQAKAKFEQQELRVLLEKVSAGVHVSVESEPVKGAPYSAEAVTESIQTLADGNRIVKRTTVRVYRDAAARTRREILGPDGQATSITISDPVNRVSYVIDPASSTVRKVQSVVSHFSTGSGVVSGGTVGTGTAVHLSTGGNEAELKARQEKHQQELATAARSSGVAGGTLTWVSPEHASTSREDLGQQTVEGVPATGTRLTDVIAAGSIGNELPITIVREEWRSPDLKVLVMTKHSDPRTGETVYRLTNISRSEPDASLFQVPAGYTVK